MLETALVQACEDERIESPGAIQAFGAAAIWSPQRDEFIAVSANIGEYLMGDAAGMIGSKPSTVIPAHILDRATKASGDPINRFNPVEFDTETGRHVGRLVAVSGGVAIEIEPGSEGNAETPFDAYMHLLDIARTPDHESDSLEVYLEAVCAGLRQFTGYDRVMAYRFFRNGDGEVIAEARREGLQPYVGLRYPATDIPQRARALYERIPVRLIVDTHAESTPLIARSGTPGDLDLSNLVLRSPSGVHIEYLRNMGVRGTLVTSIRFDGKLWGLIACHSESEPLRPGYEARSAIGLFASNVSNQVRVIEQKKRISKVSEGRAVLHQGFESIDRTRGLRDLVRPLLPSLVNAFNCQGVSAYVDDGWISRGIVPSPEVRDRFEAEIPDTDEGGVLKYTRLGLEPSESAIAGLLAIRISQETVIMLWRQAEREVVRWAGEPKETDPASPLTPRASFAEWRESRADTAAAWEESDELLLAEFRASLGTLLTGHAEQQRRMNRELTRKSEELEAFAYSVSHDLKGPIVTMRSLIGLLREDLKDGETNLVEDSVNRIDRAANRMSNLIDEMLELSRIGQQIRDLQPLELSDLVETAAQDVIASISIAEAELIVAEGMPVILGDRTSLVRAISNLLTNAAKHGCPDPGMQIRVRAEDDTDEVRLIVEDDGPGIAPEHHKRVFVLFQRMQQKVHGTGIGLALVDKVARSHGGSAHVESQLGSGARFVITLKKPRSQESPES